MKKKIILGLYMSLTAMVFAACGGNAGAQATEATIQSESTDESTENSADTAGDSETTDAAESTEIADGASESDTTADGASTTTSNEKALVAYFTRLPNTESGDDLDAVVQGGGPYGEIGDSYATADMDAIASASITVLGDEVKGNTEAVADWIAEETNGTLFSIETVEKYPVHYNAVINQGGVERRNDERPELSTQLENVDEYTTVFLGFPNWYNDMPMALYTFLETYDFSGKRIIPFATSASSGLSNAISTIEELQPNATVDSNALALVMYDVKDSENEVKSWVQSLGI